jgi:hypothetical protein
MYSLVQLRKTHEQLMVKHNVLDDIQLVADQLSIFDDALDALYIYTL